VRLKDLPAYARDTAFRMFPHRAPPGLLRIGQAGRDAPVLLTGNFSLTVRRLRDALAGRNAWLLCANSKGINVWCASGGGYLTHHDVIAAIRVSRIEEFVDHREIVLPQLCATGVERRKVTEATGWSTRWGPARLEDLPAFLERGRRVHRRERFMRFPLWERLEMAVMWTVPMILFVAPLVWWLGGAGLMAVAVALIASTVFGLFAALPWLRVKGRARWLTFGAFAAAGFAVGAGLLALAGAASPGHLAWVGAAAAGAMACVSIDLAGTTPWYSSDINASRNPVHIELVESRCTGAAECVQVCPRDVLEMNGSRRKVEIARPDQCIQCGACIVQCPEDALRFRYDDGRVVEPGTIRTTRMNMLGRRTVALRD
jgi:NAD-dependent dihydropyrimidine dehydrogenase PreA subunit